MSATQDNHSGSHGGSPHDDKITVWFPPAEAKAVIDWIDGKPCDVDLLNRATRRMQFALQEERE